MKITIESDLPKDIAKDWEAVRIGVPREGEYVITSFGDVRVFDREKHDAITRVILRRKLNPREWWPTWLLADTITLQTNEIIEIRADDGNRAYWKDTSSLVDFSWIPERLRRSGTTIKNPWKGKA